MDKNEYNQKDRLTEQCEVGIQGQRTMQRGASSTGRENKDNKQGT